METGVAVERQRKLEGNAKARLAGTVNASAAHIVAHIGARTDVVDVIVVAFGCIIDLQRHAAPLRLIASRFKKAGHAARSGCLAADESAAATKADGVGRNDAAIVALVGQDDAVFARTACIKLESAEINPRASAHLLVDVEQRTPAFVVNNIMGIAHTVGAAYVRHVNGITTGMGEVGLPRSRGKTRAPRCDGNFARCAETEGVFAVDQWRGGACEGRICRRCPGVFGIDRLNIPASTFGPVVVHYRLAVLNVALAGSIYDGAGLFEHRQEIGHDDGLGKQVFRRTIKIGTLPDPLLLFVFIVSAVTGPDEKMAAGKSARNSIGERNIANPRIAVIRERAPQTGAVFVRLSEDIGNEFVDILALSV